MAGFSNSIGKGNQYVAQTPAAWRYVDNSTHISGKKIALWSASLLAFLLIPAMLALRSSPNDSPFVSASPLPSVLEPADEINIQTQAKANNTGNSTSNSTESSVKVNVNGQNIPIPANGSVNKTVKSEGGQTNVNVQRSSSQSNAGNSSHTNLNVSAESSSSSSVNVNVNSSLTD